MLYPQSTFHIHPVCSGESGQRVCMFLCIAPFLRLYALSVIQMAEIPVMKFVPRLAAIEKGLVEAVNFAGFEFDKASVTPLLDAVYAPNV